MRRQVQNAYENIRECFSPGSVRGQRFLTYLNAMDRRAELGDTTAVKVIEQFEQFSRLINTANILR